MNFQTALEAARQGQHVKRAIWLNAIRFREGVLEFVEAVDGDRGYRPTVNDEVAVDWGVVR